MSQFPWAASPLRYPYHGLKDGQLAWFDGSDQDSITAVNTSITPVVQSATAGSPFLILDTAPGDTLTVGALIRVANADEYVIVGISGGTVEVTPNAVQNYTNAVIDVKRVSQWANQVSGGSNAAQGTSTRRPIKTIYGVYFDGTQGTSGKVLDISSFTLTQNASMFLVFQRREQTTDVAVSIHRPMLASNPSPYASSFTGYAIGLRRQGQEVRGAGVPHTGTEASFNAIPFAADNAYKLHSQVARNGVNDIYENGVHVGSVTGERTSGFASAYRLGADTSNSARYYKGILREVIIYDRALNPAERRAVERYLINKNGVN